MSASSFNTTCQLYVYTSAVGDRRYVQTETTDALLKVVRACFQLAVQTTRYDHNLIFLAFSFLLLCCVVCFLGTLKSNIQQSSAIMASFALLNEKASALTQRQVSHSSFFIEALDLTLDTSGGKGQTKIGEHSHTYCFAASADKRTQGSPGG